MRRIHTDLKLRLPLRTNEFPHTDEEENRSIIKKFTQKIDRSYWLLVPMVVISVVVVLMFLCHVRKARAISLTVASPPARPSVRPATIRIPVTQHQPPSIQYQPVNREERERVLWGVARQKKQKQIRNQKQIPDRSTDRFRSSHHFHNLSSFLQKE